MASVSRSAISFNAAGLFSAMKSRTASSTTKRLMDGIEMMVADGAGGRCEGKQIVDGRSDLESTLVTVTHHTGDPFRIDHAGPYHPSDLLFQSPDYRSFGSRVVIMEDGWPHAFDGLHCDRHAPFELVVVVAVEQIVFAIILVLKRPPRPT